MKRLKDNSDAPEARLGTLPKRIQAQTKRQSYILLARGRIVPPGCGNRRAGGKIVCGGFRGDCACGLQERPQLS